MLNYEAQLGLVYSMTNQKLSMWLRQFILYQNLCEKLWSTVWACMFLITNLKLEYMAIRVYSLPKCMQEIMLSCWAQIGHVDTRPIFHNKSEKSESEYMATRGCSVPKMQEMLSCKEQICPVYSIILLKLEVKYNATEVYFLSNVHKKCWPVLGSQTSQHSHQMKIVITYMDICAEKRTSCFA